MYERRQRLFLTLVGVTRTQRCSSLCVAVRSVLLTDRPLFQSSSQVRAVRPPLSPPQAPPPLGDMHSGGSGRATQRAESEEASCASCRPLVGCEEGDDSVCDAASVFAEPTPRCSNAADWTDCGDAFDSERCEKTTLSSLKWPCTPPGRPAMARLAAACDMRSRFFIPCAGQ